MSEYLEKMCEGNEDGRLTFQPSVDDPHELKKYLLGVVARYEAQSACDSDNGNEVVSPSSTITNSNASTSTEAASVSCSSLGIASSVKPPSHAKTGKRKEGEEPEDLASLHNKPKAKRVASVALKSSPSCGKTIRSSFDPKMIKRSAGEEEEEEEEPVEEETAIEHRRRKDREAGRKMRARKIIEIDALAEQYHSLRGSNTNLKEENKRLKERIATVKANKLQQRDNPAPGPTLSTPQQEILASPQLPVSYQGTALARSPISVPAVTQRSQLSSPGSNPVRPERVQLPQEAALIRSGNAPEQNRQEIDPSLLALFLRGRQDGQPRSNPSVDNVLQQLTQLQSLQANRPPAADAAAAVEDVQLLGTFQQALRIAGLAQEVASSAVGSFEGPTTSANHRTASMQLQQLPQPDQQLLIRVAQLIQLQKAQEEEEEQRRHRLEERQQAIALLSSFEQRGESVLSTLALQQQLRSILFNGQELQQTQQRQTERNQRYGAPDP